MAFSRLLLVVCVLVVVTLAERTEEDAEFNAGCSHYDKQFDEIQVDVPCDKTTIDVDGLGTLELKDLDHNHLQGFTATFPVAAVIVKGEKTARVHHYPPGTTSDSVEMRTPCRPDGDCPMIRHVGFCYERKVLICSLATGSYDWRFTWDIIKSINPEEYIVPVSNNPLDLTYSYDVNPTGHMENVTVSGSILLRNPSSRKYIMVTVDAKFGDLELSLDCVDSPYSPLKIEAAGSVTCNYKQTLPDSFDDMFRPVTVVVTPEPGSPVHGSMSVDIPVWTRNLVDECIQLTDSLTQDSNPPVLLSLGQKCYEWHDCMTDNFHYWVDVSKCGYHYITDSITGVTNDEGISYESNVVNVQVEAPCNLAESCDVSGNYDTSYLWTVDKSASTSLVTVEPGTDVLIHYDIAFTKTENGREQYTLSGVISVQNPNVLYNAELASVLVQYNAITVPVTWTIHGVETSVPGLILHAGDTLVGECNDFEIAEPPYDALMTVDVSVTGILISGGSETCGPADFTEHQPINDCVTVFDQLTFNGVTSYPALATQCDSGMQSFDTINGEISTRGLECIQLNATNTVQLYDPVGNLLASDSAITTVDVPCDSDISLNVNGQYSLLYTWEVTKSVSAPVLNLTINEGYMEQYCYTVEPQSHTFGLSISGVVTVINNNVNQDVNILEVGVEFPGQLPATAACDTNYLPAGDTATAICNWYMDLDAVPADNSIATAVVTTDPPFNSGSATAQMGAFPGSWTKLSTLDACVSVVDMIDSVAYTLPGQCVGVDPEAAITDCFDFMILECSCGQFEVTDQIAVSGVDTLTITWSDNVTVQVNVMCSLGCTLSQGYWKNHADPASPKYNSHWDKHLGEIFFLSGQTWLQVLNHPASSPHGTYYSLAYQYIAAILNIESGAAVVDDGVTDALTNSLIFFNANFPDTWDLSLKTTLESWKTTLEEYNLGLRPNGPPPCPDSE
ncbi:hypothetical protein Pelo_9299 [Pelomyxa schiedti]|nr:hypothetical protein Pelo_9299 [Pelomyxa schiedti]